MGLLSQKGFGAWNGYGMGMERGMERTGHQTENLLESVPEGQAPRHDLLRVPHENCPTKRHRLNKSRPFSNLDDWEQESRVWIGDIHIYIYNRNN